MNKTYPVVYLDWNTIDHLGVRLEPHEKSLVVGDILMAVEMEERLGILVRITEFWGNKTYAHVERVVDE